MLTNSLIICSKTKTNIQFTLVWHIQEDRNASANLFSNAATVQQIVLQLTRMHLHIYVNQIAIVRSIIRTILCVPTLAFIHLFECRYRRHKYQDVGVLSVQRANVSLSLITHRSPSLQLKPASIRPKVFSIVNEMLFVWIVDRITCRSSNSSRTTKCLIFISFHFPRKWRNTQRKHHGCLKSNGKCAHNLCRTYTFA